MKTLESTHVLTRIVEAKLERVRASEVRVPDAVVRKMASTAQPVPSFRNALSLSGQVRIIAEIKQASPSAGLLTESLDVAELARCYAQAGAAAISVVTEEDFFQGKLGWVGEVAKASGLPVLRKDFIFASYQLAETRAAGASAALLIAAILDPYELRNMIEACNDVGLDALVEVHDEAELAEALDAGASIVGVNNRDLKTFDVNLDTGVRLGKQIPESVLFVAESGIHAKDDIDRLRQAGADAFLVGEKLIRSADPGVALRELL